MSFRYTLLLSCMLISAPINVSHASSLPFQGINLSADETGSGWDGFANTLTQIMPTVADAFYDPANIASWTFAPVGENGQTFQSVGMNTVRLPFRWDYLFQKQTSIDNNITSAALESMVEPTYLKDLAQQINALMDQGNVVILDAHDYMQWNPSAGASGGYSFGALVTEGQIAVIWTAIIDELDTAGVDITNPLLWYEISNEPNGISAANAYSLDVAGLAAIRKRVPNNKILVEGTSWSGLHAWFDSDNADAFQGLSQQDANVAIAMHQYFDTDYSGTGDTCSDTTSTLQSTLTQLSTWMSTYGVDVILDEFGTPDGQEVCKDDVQSVLDSMASQAPTSNTAALSSNTGGHYLGWTVWNYSPVYKDVNFISAPDDDTITNIYLSYLK
jgi:endoglucanase